MAMRSRKAQDSGYLNGFYAAIRSPRVLGLASNLYPSNLQRMLNKDLNRFMQSFSSTRKSSKWKKLLCCQGAFLIASGYILGISKAIRECVYLGLKSASNPSLHF